MNIARIFANPLLLAFYGGAFASVTSGGIQWGKCPEEFEGNKTANVTIQCASLAVPLDYTNTMSSKTIDLQLLRAPAIKQPSKGSILFNFGGPGQLGRLDLVSRLYENIPATGYENDLIIFDPRGTGNTLPAPCYSAETSAGLAAYSDITNSSDTALGVSWAKNGMIAGLCHQKLREIGSFLGTSFVARDLMEVVDALGEDGMLRYWGHSYGTTLGATAAAMFPDRVESMVLDGVLNSHEYYHAYDLEWLTDTDRVWLGFFEGCVAAPHACPLAHGNATATELAEEFYDFLYRLKTTPVPTPLGILADYTALKNSVVKAIYDTSTWPLIAAQIKALYDDNGVAILGLNDSKTSDVTSNAQEAIKCADKTMRTPTIEGMMHDVQSKYSISRLVGDVYVSIDFKCAQWEMQAKEIFSGNFQTKTKNPILFVSNTYDPLTPLISAKNMSSGFEGSVLLEQVAYGHGVFAQPSVCAVNAIQRYFLDGELPSPGTICNSQQDLPLFSDRNATHVLLQLDVQPPKGYQI